MYFMLLHFFYKIDQLYKKKIIIITNHNFNTCNLLKKKFLTTNKKLKKNERFVYVLKLY